jgi:probable phosphoglycerate mutase
VWTRALAFARLMDATWVVPAVNQIEMHPYFHQPDVLTDPAGSTTSAARLDSPPRGRASATPGTASGQSRDGACPGYVSESEDRANAPAGARSLRTVTGVGQGPRDERLLLIARHGQGFANAERTIAGPSCLGLTETGRAQARGLARRLARTGGVNAIHASTTARAMQTAQTIGGALRVNPRRQSGLRVPDPGLAEGTTWAAARQAWPADPFGGRPQAPGREPWLTYLARAQQSLSGILGAHPGGRVLVVGHNETLAAMIALCHERDDQRGPRPHLDFCAVSTWQLLDARVPEDEEWWFTAGWTLARPVSPPSSIPARDRRL